MKFFLVIEARYEVKSNCKGVFNSQDRIEDFSEEEAPTSRGASTLYIFNCSEKISEIKDNFVGRGARRAFLLGSVNAF